MEHNYAEVKETHGNYLCEKNATKKNLQVWFPIGEGDSDIDMPNVFIQSVQKILKSRSLELAI